MAELYYNNKNRTNMSQASSGAEVGSEAAYSATSTTHREAAHRANLSKNKAAEMTEEQRLASLKENRAVKWLKLTIFIVLIGVAATMSIGTYVLIRNDEKQDFETYFAADATKVIESFQLSVEKRLNAIGILSTYITTYALANNLTFPMVTIPSFEVMGSAARVLAGALIIHWAPLVTDEKRLEWEAYALENRFQIDEAYERDEWFRKTQDEQFGYGDEKGNGTSSRFLQNDDGEETPEYEVPVVLEDGTGYKPRIYANTPKTGQVVEPEGTGPFLPAWQRSPIDPGKQSLLNMNAGTAKLFAGLLSALLENSKTVTLGTADVPYGPAKKAVNVYLGLSQYRHDFATYNNDDPITYMVYPVFDNFGPDKKLAGALVTNLYWKQYLSNTLPSTSRGIICVLNNSFNQTFTYRVDGEHATFLGPEDHHNPAYDDMVHTAEINSYVAKRASPENHAYTTMPLNQEFGVYRLSVYPSEETQDEFYTKKPVTFTIAVVAIFAFTSSLFLMYDYCAERRQRIVRDRALENAHRAAATEREMNEYIAHEIRNPLAAAVAACNFVTSAVDNQQEVIADVEQLRKTVLNDVTIIHSSLQYMNTLLGDMLDIHHAWNDDLGISMSPTNIRKDIFEPVAAMLNKRDDPFGLVIDCGNLDNLEVMADPLRLKQVIMNLAQNSAKFVEKGFIKLKVAVEGGMVVLSVEDSGPGVPAHQRATLFSKFRGSLGKRRRGAGIGLCICKEVVEAMGGEIFLDKNYDSQVYGCHGARFVVCLNHPPLQLDNTSNPASPQHSVEDTLTTYSLPVAPRRDDSIEESIPPPQLPDCMSVLFVDDDLMLRKLFTRGVKRVAPNWNVQEAASGEAAIHMVVNDKQEFHLIFMDQYMPGPGERQLLGTETTRVLRSKGCSSIICGLSANDMEMQFLDANANDFMIKPLPCKKEELQQLLIRLIFGQNQPVGLHDSGLLTEAASAVKLEN